MKLAGILIGAIVTLPLGLRSTSDVTSDEWTEAGRWPIADGYTNRPPGRGYMGASSIGVSFGRVVGGVMIQSYERETLQVFIGVALPPSMSADGDLLRVQFVDEDGGVHESKHAGVGSILQCHTPPRDVDFTSLREFRVLYKDDPRWNER